MLLIGHFMLSATSNWVGPQPHPGTQVIRCGCFLPDLTEFTNYCCERTRAPSILLLGRRLTWARLLSIA